MAGLKAIATGFGLTGLKDDHEILDREFIVYDALYGYRQNKWRLPAKRDSVDGC